MNFLFLLYKLRILELLNSWNESCIDCRNMQNVSLIDPEGKGRWGERGGERKRMFTVLQQSRVFVLSGELEDSFN